MKYPWAYPGSKVVCVDNTTWPFFGKWAGDQLVQGKTYTIIGIHDGRGIDKGLLIVELAEAKANAVRDGSIENGYRAYRFRPLHDTTRQLEAMREIVRKARGRVDA